MLFIPADNALPAGALVLANTDDVLALGDRLAGVAVIGLHFPKWTDGRAYSQAVLADMLPLLRRCGFDAVQLRADQRLESAQRALGFFDGHYQTAAQLGVPPAHRPQVRM